MDVISYECAREVNDILGKSYAILFHTLTKNCYRGGGYPEIDVFYYYDDPFNIDDDTCCAFTLEELNKLMNEVVLGDYRKSEFEAIDNIDEYAYKLKEYIEKKKKDAILS